MLVLHIIKYTYYKIYAYEYYNGLKNAIRVERIWELKEMY